MLQCHLTAASLHGACTCHGERVQTVRLRSQRTRHQRVCRLVEALVVAVDHGAGVLDQHVGGRRIALRCLSVGLERRLDLSRCAVRARKKHPFFRVVAPGRELGFQAIRKLFRARDLFGVCTLIRLDRR